MRQASQDKKRLCPAVDVVTRRHQRYGAVRSEMPAEKAGASEVEASACSYRQLARQKVYVMVDGELAGNVGIRSPSVHLLSNQT